MNQLYILIGLPYSGKTTLRKELVKRLNFDYVSVDEIMKERDMWRFGQSRYRLSKQFPNQWIAIKNRAVIASDSNHEVLLNELQTQGEIPGLVLRCKLEN